MVSLGQIGFFQLGVTLARFQTSFGFLEHPILNISSLNVQEKLSKFSANYTLEILFKTGLDIDNTKFYLLKVLFVFKYFHNF